MSKVAILIDGGFYRKRAKYLWGEKSAEARARELEAYCQAHLKKKDAGVERFLYRIFYYDCKPIGRKTVYHPLTKKNVDLDKSDTYNMTQSSGLRIQKEKRPTLDTRGAPPGERKQKKHFPMTLIF